MARARPKRKAKKKPAKVLIGVKALKILRRDRKRLTETVAENAELRNSLARATADVIGIHAILRVLVPNARRWVEAAHAGTARQQMLDLAGITDAEARIGKADYSEGDPVRQRREAIERGDAVPPCEHPRTILQKRQVLKDGLSGWVDARVCKACGEDV